MERVESHTLPHSCGVLSTDTIVPGINLATTDGTLADNSTFSLTRVRIGAASECMLPAIKGVAIFPTMVLFILLSVGRRTAASPRLRRAS